MATPNDLANAASCYCFDAQRTRSIGIYLLATKAGLSASTPAQLAASAKCYCYDDNVARGVAVYLLAVNAGLTGSTPSALATLAKYYCYDDATFRGVATYLLSSLAGTLSTTPSGLAVAANCYCFDEGTSIRVAIYLLAVIAGLQQSSPSSLASLGICYCYDRATWKKVVAYLLNNSGSPPPPPLIVSEDFEVAAVPPNWTVSTTGSGVVAFGNAVPPAPLLGAGSLRLTNNGGNATAVVNWLASSGAQPEVWVGFRFNAALAAGDNEFAFRLQDSTGTDVVDVRIFQGISQVQLFCGGNSVNSIGSTADNTTFFCWLHYKASVSQADFEFETTNARLGSGNNFCTVSAPPAASIARFFVGLQAVGSASFMVFDQLRISNTGYPSL